MPNLWWRWPVEMCGWPPAITSGFTRMAAGARRRCRDASLAKSVQLRFRFDVEQTDARAQGFANFFARFADAGKNDAAGGNARRAASSRARRRKQCRSRCPGSPAGAGWKDWNWPSASSRWCAAGRAGRGPWRDRRRRCWRRCRRTRACAPGPRCARRRCPRNGAARNATRTAACRKPDRPPSGAAAHCRTARRGRSQDFHHHERAVVLQRRPLRELVHFVDQSIGQIVRAESAVRLDQRRQARNAEETALGIGRFGQPSEWNTRTSPGSRITDHSS